MFVLKNKAGLYLISLSKNRNDYGFSAEKDLALQFNNREEAEKKRQTLMRFNCIVSEL